MLLKSLIVFGTLVTSVPVLAECPPDESVPQVRAIVVNNIPGVFFPEQRARCILYDIERFDLLQTELRLVREQLDLRSDQVRRLTLAIDQYQNTVDSLETALDESERRRRRLAANWRKPWVWLLIGTALGFGVGLGIAL